MAGIKAKPIIKFGTNVISIGMTQWDAPEAANEIDTTTFDDTAKTAVPDDPDLTAAASGYQNTTIVPAMTLVRGDEDTIQEYPTGSDAAGQPVFTSTAVVLGRGRGYQVGGIAGWNVNFRILEDWVQGVAA
jgi:hypothetical protein